jgi:hypothetical protein
MPLRVPQQAAVARLIVLPMPQQPMVEADTEAANTVNQQVLTIIVAANHKPEAAEPDSSAAFCILRPRSCRLSRNPERSLGTSFLRI